MDTKSKKFRYSKWFKSAVILLSLFCVVSESVLIYRFASNSGGIFSYDSFDINSFTSTLSTSVDLNDPKCTFYQSEPFETAVSEYCTEIIDYCKTYKNIDYFKGGAATQTLIDDINEEYDDDLAQKIARIRTEYINEYLSSFESKPNVYDSSDYDYDYEETTMAQASQQKSYYDEKTAEQIISLFPDDLKQEYEKELEYARQSIESARKANLENVQSRANYDFSRYTANLFSDLKSMTWIAVDKKTGEVYTNLGNLDKTDYESAVTGDGNCWYLVYKDYDSIKTPTIKCDINYDTLQDSFSLYTRGKNNDSRVYSLKNILNIMCRNEMDIYLGLNKNFASEELDSLKTPDENTIKPQTLYQSLQTHIENVNTAKSFLIKSAVLFVSWIICLVILANSAGKTVQNEPEIKLCFVDKMWNDIHFILSFLLTASILSFVFELTSGGFNISLIIGLPIAYLVFLEWFISVARNAKAHIYFSHTAINKLIVTPIKKLFSYVGDIRKLSADTAHISKKIVYGIVSFIIINAILSLLLSTFTNGNGVAYSITLFIFIAYNAFSIVYALKYLRSLNAIFDVIQKTKEGNFDVAVDMDVIPKSLKPLANDVTEMQSGMKIAVANAVKGERMKTELITNVSHDLKTPLTSIINYVDLLKRCELDDEKANQYLDVLSDKSLRLKNLIDDLMEASKLSTGNVKLAPAEVNLYELAIQAIGESEDMLEERGLAIKFAEPKNQPIVFADGQKTWRIISNLIGNVKKYALANSRVYIDIGSDENYGIFSMKNISANELNVSPEALTQRFVQGDEARSTEGSGLGLSIAKNLCELQGGELLIEIDGDLFKATVKLPLVHGIDKTEPQ